MPRVSHSVCLKHGKREKRDLELEESELSLLCYAVMGIFVRFFFKLGSRERLPLNNSTCLQGGCYSDKCSSVWKIKLEQREQSTAVERGALSVKEEGLLCPVWDSSTLLQGWKAFLLPSHCN